MSVVHAKLMFSVGGVRKLRVEQEAPVGKPLLEDAVTVPAALIVFLEIVFGKQFATVRTANLAGVSPGVDFPGLHEHRAAAGRTLAAGPNRVRAVHLCSKYRRPEFLIAQLHPWCGALHQLPHPLARPRVALGVVARSVGEQFRIKRTPALLRPGANAEDEHEPKESTKRHCLPIVAQSAGAEPAPGMAHPSRLTCRQRNGWRGSGVVDGGQGAARI